MTISTAASDPGRAGGPGCDGSTTRFDSEYSVSDSLNISPRASWRPRPRARPDSPSQSASLTRAKPRRTSLTQLTQAGSQAKSRKQQMSSENVRLSEILKLETNRDDFVRKRIKNKVFRGCLLIYKLFSSISSNINFRPSKLLIERWETIAFIPPLTLARVMCCHKWTVTTKK